MMEKEDGSVPVECQWRDLAGNVIRPGNYVVYAAALGRSSVLKYGRVTRLATREIGWGPASKRSTIKVKTVELTHRWDHETGKSIPAWALQKKGKDVTLGELDRVQVIDSFRLPEEVLELLDG